MSNNKVIIVLVTERVKAYMDPSAPTEPLVCLFVSFGLFVVGVFCGFVAGLQEFADVVVLFC